MASDRSSGEVAGHVRRFYADHHDRITDKRYNSPYWARRWAHRTIYERSLRWIRPGMHVLDAGCGEGTLSILMAERGALVTGIDISRKNVVAALDQAQRAGVDATFCVGDLECLPFSDDAFDLVVSSHVVEHLPNPEHGLREILRVTCYEALIVMPTCLNPAAWSLLGGGGYWKLNRRAPFAWLIGLFQTFWAFLRGFEGPQEGYEGREDLPHIWRFPWVLTRMVRGAGFRVEDVEGGPLLVPYLGIASILRPLQIALDHLHRVPGFRCCGLGTHILARKHASPPA